MDVRSDQASRIDERADAGRRSAAQTAIYEAVAILQAEHEVGEPSAYMILVQSSVDLRLSVHEAAKRIVEAQT